MIVILVANFFEGNMVVSVEAKLVFCNRLIMIFQKAEINAVCNDISLVGSSVLENINT